MDAKGQLVQLGRFSSLPISSTAISAALCGVCCDMTLRSMAPFGRACFHFRCLAPSRLPLRSFTRSYAAPHGKSWRLNPWLVIGSAALIATTWSLVPLQAEARAPDSDSSFAVSTSTKGRRVVSYAELQKHATAQDCWVAINGQVYEPASQPSSKAMQVGRATHATSSNLEQPGGANVVLKHAGQDATEVYKPIHPPTAISENLSREQHIGPLDLDTLPKDLKGPSEADLAQQRREELPPVDSMISLDDFEKAAEHVLGSNSQAFAYYRSAADDEVAFERNRSAWSYLNFVPKVFVPAEEVSTAATLLGHRVQLPIFIAPAALARLGHPDGELNLARGAANRSGIQCISSNASCSMDELAAAREEKSITGDKAIFWFQLYLARDRSKSEKAIQKALDSGCSAIFLTCDAPVGGKRERDLRAKGDYYNPNLGPSNSVSGAQFSYMDPNISWSDIAWVKKRANVPLIAKGIGVPAPLYVRILNVAAATVEDALIAKSTGADGIVLSNHGGRQLEFSPPPLATLIKIRREAPHLLDDPHFSVFIDGGIRRGSDVIKALCLGANGVALGRPFLYAQTCYGVAGVQRVYDILEDEIATTMRLLGVKKLTDLKPTHLELLDGLLGKPI